MYFKKVGIPTCQFVPSLPPWGLCDKPNYFQIKFRQLRTSELKHGRAPGEVGCHQWDFHGVATNVRL